MTHIPISLTQIGQIGVPVRDLDAATAFYRDVLGMEFVFQVPGMMSFFNCGDIRLMLAVPTAPEYDHPNSIIYYRVADIDAAYTALTAKKVTFLRAPHSIGKMGDVVVWMAFFKDVAGNTLAIMSEKLLIS